MAASRQAGNLSSAKSLSSAGAEGVSVLSGSARLLTFHTPRLWRSPGALGPFHTITKGQAGLEIHHGNPETKHYVGVSPAVDILPPDSPINFSNSSSSLVNSVDLSKKKSAPAFMHS